MYVGDFSSVQFSRSVRSDSFRHHESQHAQACLSITNSRSSLRLTSIESVMPSSHLILCRPLLLLPSIFPSIRVFPNESVLCITLPMHWIFSFSISPFNEYSELISFRMDWLDLLAVQGILKRLLQHHSSKVSILWRSAFFMVRRWGLGVSVSTLCLSSYSEPPCVCTGICLLSKPAVTASESQKRGLTAP